MHREPLRMAVHAWRAACCAVGAAACAGAAVVPVDDARVRAGFSPSNWVVSAGAASTTVCGASLTVGFRGTRNVALAIDTSAIALPSPRRYPILAWTVDGGAVQTRQLAAGDTSIVLATDVADPVIDLFVKGMCPFGNRHEGDPPPNSVTITGFVVDDGATTVAAVQPPGVWLSIGDSITSGDGAAYAEGQGRPPDDLWAEADDGRASYAWLLARHFGRRESRLAYGGYNWTGGIAGVPPLVTLVERQTNRASRLAGDVLEPPPDVVTVNLGTNGRPRPEDVAAALAAVRKRAGPRAVLLVMIPFNGAARAEVTAGFDAYRKASGDARAHLVDLGEFAFATCDGVHPTAAGHRTIFERAVPVLEPILRRAGVTPAAAPARAATVLVEAESFADHGGWSLDTQFIGEMGSPYLLAHGLGVPVADATTTVAIPTAGTYRVFVRTKDWVARWQAPGTPGKFQVLVNGTPLAEIFGTRGAEWGWHDGGTVALPAGEATLALHDLTGFDGRCDCIVLTTEAAPPPNDSGVLADWRRRALDLPADPETKGPYGLVVVGGGYSGMGAALAAARMGVKVALLQDRGVLGGNGSSEVRVWAQGLIRRGRYPRIGEMVEEFADKATKSPGTFEEFGDAKKEALVRAEPNIDLVLHAHAFAVAKDGNRITSVTCLDTRTGREIRVTGALFCDATGHATIGHLAGAETVMEPKGRMGMSNMWAWKEGDAAQAFPETPWALPLTMADFPYPRDHHGQWFWESGFDKDPLGDAEGIRDWNLRAVFGAWNAMKNGDGAARHRGAALTWVAYVGGPRESRRILGDVVLTQDDIVSKRDFPDGCVPSTWSIDLHYPKQEYARKFPDNPFISIAKHDNRVDRTYGFPVPYRCFYSKDVSNLFMAGRCISVTHEALGTVRVMKTCGMMGEVVGKAASVALKEGTTPRGVFERHWPDLDELLKLPGRARRASLAAAIEIPADSAPPATPEGPPTGIDPATLARDKQAVVGDDREAKREGDWTEGHGLEGYVGTGYHYAAADSGATATFELAAPAAGTFDVLVAWQPHENRGTAVPVLVETAAGRTTTRLDMRKRAPIDGAYGPVGRVTLGAGDACVVVIATDGARGFAHADAVLLVPVR